MFDEASAPPGPATDPGEPPGESEGENETRPPVAEQPAGNDPPGNHGQ